MRTILVPVMIIGALLFSPHLSWATSPGTTAANFLKIGVGARGAALGDALTAVVDDSTSLYWNPAGLARMKERQLSATYNMWLAGINQGYVSIGVPLSGRGIVAGDINYVDMGAFDGRDVSGNPTGTFSASALTFKVGYADRLTRKLLWGVSAGIVQDTIAGSTTSTYAANLGLIFQSSDSLSFGLTLQNIGGELRGSPLPFIVKLGAAFSGKSSLYLLDIAKPIDSDVSFALGVEWWLQDLIALRVGYKSSKDTQDGITAGLGFKTGTLQVDYAYTPYGELGSTHKVSVGMTF